MPLLELTSKITIGSYTFRGVHDVRIRKGIHGYTEQAWLLLPTKAWIKKGNSVSEEQTTGTLIADGDSVKIELGYNGELRTEFEGFVRRRNLGLPLEIECEGYSYKLRLKYMNVNLSKGIEVSELLKLVCAGTDIKVECPVSFKMYGRNLVNASGTQVLDEIRRCTDRAITIFFKEPRLLWCGLVYTPYLAGAPVFNLPQANYRLGWNVIKDNTLRERVPTEQVQVVINGMLATGDSVRTESDEKVAKRKVQFLLNGLHDEAVLRDVANEKQQHANYSGYEGYINAFLQPYCAPGWNALIKDDRYPERDGVYLIESTEVAFGVRGARRRIGVGVKLG